MTTDGPTDTSASSRAEFNGVMIVDTVATTLGKPKTLYITGAFYTTLGILMGVFKYFNQYDHVIEPKSRWFVNTTVRLHRFFFFQHFNRRLGCFVRCRGGF
jgi:hypothetical protein